MKVQCSFCEHEKNGFCLKKGRGAPIKVKTGKRRKCSVYKATFRKTELHRQKMKQMAIQRARTEQAIVAATNKVAERKVALMGSEEQK
jgi:hypothetical protein